MFTHWYYLKTVIYCPWFCLGVGLGGRIGRPELTVDSKWYSFMRLRMKGHDSVGFPDTVLSSLYLYWQWCPLFFCALKDYINASIHAWAFSLIFSPTFPFDKNNLIFP